MNQTFKQAFGPNCKEVWGYKLEKKMGLNIISQIGEIEASRSLEIEFDKDLKSICDELNLDYFE